MPGTLVGSVRDAAALTPIGNAELTLAYFGGLTAQTDVSGVYLFPALPPGDYSVTVEAEGYLGQTQTINVSEGGVATLDIDLQATVVLTVRVEGQGR